MKLMAAFECHINYANRYTSAKLDDPNPEVQKKVRTDLGRLAFLRTLIRGNLPQYGCNKHPSLFD
jgi:hypothetical protein